jgi:hypothetical protein
VTLALALSRRGLVTFDATMADVVRRSRLDFRFGCEHLTGPREDFDRLRARLASATGSNSQAAAGTATAGRQT